VRGEATRGDTLKWRDSGPESILANRSSNAPDAARSAAAREPGKTARSARLALAASLCFFTSVSAVTTVIMGPCILSIGPTPYTDHLIASVELRREKSLSAFEDRVRAAQLTVLLLELGNPRDRVRGDHRRLR